MTAPLMLGIDVLHMSAEVQDIILNQDAIAINQDPTEQGRKIMTQEQGEAWVKQLSDGGRAVLLINRSTKEQAFKLHRHELGLVQRMKAYDIYQKQILGLFDEMLATTLKPGTGLFLKVTPTFS